MPEPVEPTLAVSGQAKPLCGLAAAHDALEDLLAAHHHADRPSDFLGGDRGCDRFLADAELRSEPASDIARDDPHPVLFDTQRVGEFGDIVVQHL